MLTTLQRTTTLHTHRIQNHHEVLLQNHLRCLRPDLQLQRLHYREVRMDLRGLLLLHPLLQTSGKQVHLGRRDQTHQRRCEGHLRQLARSLQSPHRHHGSLRVFSSLHQQLPRHLQPNIDNTLTAPALYSLISIIPLQPLPSTAQNR